MASERIGPPHEREPSPEEFERLVEQHAADIRSTAENPSPAPNLLPCPFCGEVPTLIRETEGAKWGAVVCCCTGPEVRTHYRPVEHWKLDAIAAWNRRAPESPEVSALRAALEGMLEASAYGAYMPAACGPDVFECVYCLAGVNSRDKGPEDITHTDECAVTVARHALLSKAPVSAPQEPAREGEEE